MTALFVVSGLPASGKSTLASALARELGVAHLDKDTFLEVLLSQTPVLVPAERAALSRQADAQFQDQALRLSAAVLSSWWRHPQSKHESGTPIGWLSACGHRVVEVHCQCPAPEALRRFTARKRHPGHLDALRSLEGLRTQFEESESHGPLFPGHAIVYNTGTQGANASLAGLVEQVRQRITAASAP